ncbi:MAG TPA: hypothetical protein VD905_10435 [Flavobacteriales bacterium]|nr:hypothetical protein [Flavobacteriales bacterium]
MRNSIGNGNFVNAQRYFQDRLKKAFLFFFVLSSVSVFAQRNSDSEQMLTAGFQFRPVFATGFLDDVQQTNTHQIFTATIEPALGYTFGMLIRRSFTRKISFETGINYIRRNFTLTCVDDSLNRTDVSDFGMVSYEIPLQCLVYVRFGERFYMNNSLGVSINWFASKVASFGESKDFSQVTYLNRVIANPALLANVGFEYRTRKAGYFYLGSSLHRPFTRIGTSVVKYDLYSKKYQTNVGVTGSFLTLDVRYFFHAQPIKKKTQNMKKKEDEKKGKRF